MPYSSRRARTLQVRRPAADPGGAEDQHFHAPLRHGDNQAQSIVKALNKIA